MRHWLVKSEPDAYSIDDLKRDGTTHWDGVRNYQARNFMRDDMKVGDKVLFYHSNCKPPGVVGVASVVKAAYPDHTALDPNSAYFDSKSDPEKPRWMMVDIGFERKLETPIPLDLIKAHPDLSGMPLVQKGQRLSVQPVGEKEFQTVLSMAHG